MTEPCGITAPDVLKAVPGLTVRRLDFWSRTGRLLPHFHPHLRGVGADGRPDHGQLVDRSTGTHACYSPAEVEIARRMVMLIRAGFDVPAAAEVARETVEAGRWHTRRGGVYVLLEGCDGYKAHQAAIRALRDALSEARTP